MITNFEGGKKNILNVRIYFFHIAMAYHYAFNSTLSSERAVLG